MLGLPDAVTACLFDMDGVITQTATVHDAAWKEMFDDFLRSWSASHDVPFVPFDPVSDYDQYVDGKPRLEGTASFLKSRGIELPMGEESDPAGTLTVWGLGNRKNDLILEVLARDGVQAYEGSVRYVKAVRDVGRVPRSCRRARTPRRCSRRPAWRDCSRSGSTTRWRRRPACAASPPGHVPRGGAPARRHRGERHRLRGRASRRRGRASRAFRVCRRRRPRRPGRSAPRARRRRGSERPIRPPVRGLL